MKKFAFGILGLFILLGGMFMTACGKTVSLSVSTQEVVVYTNDSQEENYQSKEIEVTVDNSKLGVGVEILDGQDCIDIEKTNTSTKKANGKYAFLIKTKENKNSGTAKVNVWSIEDRTKSKVINVTVNTVLEHLVATSDDSEDNRTDLYVVKGVQKNLVPKEFFDFSPTTANVDELVWTFDDTGTQTFSVDGQVRATIEGSTLLVLNSFSMDEIKLRASFVRNSTISEVVTLKVIETSTIRDFVVEDKEFYKDGVSYISGATVSLKRNDSNNSRVEGTTTVNTTYPMDFSLVVTDTETKRVLTEEEYENYFVFDITSSDFKTDTTTYHFYIDALDTTDERVYGKFLLQFKFSYRDYNFDIVPSNINLTTDISYTATRVDIYNESKNMINNSSIDVFSSYVSSYGYKIQPIVQPETIKIDNNMFHIAIDVNQSALVGRLPSVNPIDSLAKFYYHGTYLKFRQESNTSSVFISENITSGSEVYMTAVRTFENVRMSVQSAANNTISSDIYVYLYQITSDDDLNITVTRGDEEVVGDTYISSIQGAEREVTFEAQIDGISTIAGLSLKSGKKVDGEYVENGKFIFSNLEVLESDNSNDDKHVKVRFVASLTAYNFTDETSFWFEHVTNKMSSRYTIKAFVPITSASVLSTEASSDIYINRNAAQGFKVEGELLLVDDKHVNTSVSKLMVEAGATLTLSTEYRNATLSDKGISYKFLNYKDMLEIPDLEGLGIDPEEVFENSDLEKLTQIYSYFEDVNTALLNISQSKLIVSDSAFKGFVCVLFGGYNENHEETTFVRMFALESFYSVRYLSSNAKTKLLYTVETLSQTDMSRSYVDVTVEMRPDTKIPTYSNLMDKLHFSSANTTLEGSNEIGYQNQYYQISAISFSNGGRYINFRVTAYSTNLQTYFKDSLVVTYEDGNGREKTAEIQLEIRNVKRIENVEWVNQTYSNEIYLNLTSSYQSDKNFTVSTSVLPSDANDVGLTYQYYAVSGAATDLDVTVNTIGQTFNVNISTTVGGYGYLYLLPNDMLKVVEGTRKLLLYKYTEDEYGEIVDEVANYSIGLSQLNERYQDIINGTSEIDPFFLNNDGEKIYYRDIILKIYVVIADGRSSDTAIRVYSQTDLENVDTALYYKLMNDINLVGWETLERFSGEIDGQGCTLNFSENSRGLVYTLSGALKNINVTGNIVGGDTSYVGGLAAYVEANGLIDGCSVDVSYNSSSNTYSGAKLSAESALTSYAGFIAGRNDGTISNTYIYGASIVSNADYTGGFVGWNFGKIVDSGYEFYKAAAGETQNSVSVSTKFGGFVGRAGATSVIERAYVYSYVDESLVTGPSPKAFAGSVAGGATFSECFAYLYDVKTLFDTESTDAVSVSNCYLTYDNEGSKNVDVYLPGQSAVTLHNATESVAGADTTVWQTTSIDAGVNFGFMHLINVQENAKVDPDELTLNETQNSLQTADDKKGILVVYKPTVSIVNEAEKSELTNYNTISIQELFSLAGEQLTERQARSLLLSSTNKNLAFTSRNIRMLSATQAEFEVVARSKMDATLTSVFRFIIANKVPKLVTMVDGYELKDTYMVMLQTTKSKNVIYSTSSTISLNGNVYNLEKDQYQIDNVVGDENVSVSRNSNIVALNGTMAHVGGTYTTLETKMSVGAVDEVYKTVLTLTRNVNVTVYNGATAFAVRNAAGLVVKASQAATFEAYMTTDDENDNLSLSLGYGQIVIESSTNSDSEADFDVDGKLSLNVVWSKTLIAEKQYKFVATIRIDSTKLHLVDEVYENLKLYVKPSSQADNDDYTNEIDFAVDVQGLEDLSMNIYRIDGRLVKNSVLYLSRANELLTTLTPSSDAIVAVMVDPAYAQMTHFNLTYSATGTGSLGTISITKLSYSRDYGYYTNVTNSTIITNGIRVNITDADMQGQGVYYFRIYASSAFTGEATIQFNATFFNGNEALLSSKHNMTISSLQEAEIKVNGSSTYLLAKGESATVTVTVGANQSMHNLYLQNSGANISLSDVTITNYGSYIEYTATLYAGVDAELNTGSDSGVFYVCATVERIVNGVQEIKVSRATICLVDFGIDTASTKVGNSSNKASYNGREYDAVYTYVNSENELYFDYKLLPEEYIYDKSDASEEAKVAEIMRKRNLFLNNYYHMDDNAGYYINCVYNENRGIYEALTIQEQLWFASDESHYSAAYNKNYNEFAQNDYFNLSMSNQGNLIIGGKRTGSQLMMLRTRVVYQGIEFVRDYFFLVVVEVWTDEDAPLTISTAEEFVDKATNGDKAADYVLTNDIVLKDYEPIKNTELFNSFDGNGYTIHIESFKLPTDSSTVRLALFDTVSANTTLKNVKVNIYNGGQIVLNVDQYKAIYVAGFAISNYGVIYNSEVVSYYNSEYQASKVSGDTGIVVSYTKGAGMDAIELTSLMDIESHVAGFVYENDADASIVNSRVGGKELAHFTTLNGTTYLEHVALDTFVVTGQGEVSGFICQNDGYISASYAKNVQINNNMNSNASITAGFALYNSNSIQNSYIEGLGGEVDQYGDLLPAFNLSSIKAKGIVAGFVYTNAGLVKNAYSNIKIESTSYSSAGFVYINQSEGTVSICYSACEVSKKHIGQMQFSGVNAFEESLNSGKLELCYYYDDDRTNNSNEAKLGTGAIAINDVFDIETFYGYSFASAEGAYNGVWEMTSEGVSIVSANQIAISNRYVRNVGTTAQTTVIYNTSVRDIDTYELYQISYGSVYNPIIIRSAEEFAKATGKATDKEISSYKNWYTDSEVKGNYRIVYNIDMSEIGQEDDDLKAVRLQTTRKTFSGILDGNGFTITNVSLGSQSSRESFGLFAKLDGAVIMNLDILVSSVHDSEAAIVGTFAGIAVDSRLLAISLAPVATAETGSAHTAVQGNNIVGGVVGLLVGDSYMSDITVSSVDVESVYYKEGKKITENRQYTNSLRSYIDGNLWSRVSSLSYAGGVVGYVDIYKTFSNPFMQYDAYKTTEFNVVSIKVKDSVDIFAEIAGGLFGYVGKNTMVYDASITLNANMSKSNPSYIISKNLFAGGIVGENYGALHAVYAKHSETLQKDIEEHAYSYYNGTYGAERGQQTIFSYQSDDKGYTERVNNPKFVGGIVGYMGGGFIYVAYNKLNVISYTSGTEAVGGIVGLLGRTSNSYTVSFLTREKTANYLFYDVYASGDVYTASGVSGGIIGQLAGREETSDVAQTPSIVMKDVMAVNYYSIDIDTKKLSGETYSGTFDGSYTSENHFTLVGGIYSATDGETLALNSDIYLISNYNDVYIDVYNAMSDSTAGDNTVGGFNKLKVGNLTINLNFFGFGIAAGTEDKILNAKHLGEVGEQMSYAYSRMYAYFIARGWDTKYWNHKQDTLYPEIELLPKLSIIFWDWYNTDDVLTAMRNSSVTVVVRGKVEEKSDVIKDIDLRMQNNDIWTGVVKPTGDYIVETFRGRLYSYNKYMNSTEGGQITAEIIEDNNRVGGKVGEVAGIILDKSLFNTITGSVIVDGVSFYFEESGTSGVNFNFAHVIEDSIVRNCQFVVNKDLTLTTKSEKTDKSKTIYAAGLIADVARSTSIINNQVLFRKVTTNVSEKSVNINFVSLDAEGTIQNVGLFVGLMQQDSQFANITLQNCFFDEYGRKLDEQTDVEFNFVINDGITKSHDFAFGTFVGKVSKQGGAKFGAEMIQFYHSVNIKYTCSATDANVSVGAYFGEVDSLSTIEYVVPDKKPSNLDKKIISISATGAKAINAGLFIGLVDSMSGRIADASSTEHLGEIVFGGANSAENNIGGVIGKVNACPTFSVSSISVNANITASQVAANANVHVGGIVGSILGGETAISNCNSLSGKVALSASAENIYAGGMVGYVNNSTVSITTTQANSTNTVDFVISNATNAYVGGYIGYACSKSTLSIGESGETLSYGLVELEKLVMTDENETSTGKVEYTNVKTFTFGGAVGQTNSTADVNVKSFVYRGFVKANVSDENILTAGGVVGSLGVGSDNSATISNNVSYGDVFVKYEDDDDQLSKYAFGGIVGEINADTDGDKNTSISVQDNYALMTNFNTRTTYKLENKDYYVGAVIGYGAENATVKEDNENYYSSGVCLAYQEEDGYTDLPYTDQETYYGYMKTASVNDFEPQTKGILSKISGSIGEDVGQSKGTKLNPLGFEKLSDSISSTKKTNGINWVSVNADMTLSQQLVTGDALKNTAIVGNGHTITRKTNETSDATLEAGFVGTLGDDSDGKITHQFISNLMFDLNLEEDTTLTTYGGVVGKMTGNSILYAVGAKGDLSIGGTKEIDLGGLVGVLNGGLIDNCYVDLDIIYRAKSERAGNTSAITNISSGFSTVAETFALGMITQYTGSTDNTVHVYTFANISSDAKASLYDNYTLMQYDDTKIVVGNASATPLYVPSGVTLVYMNNNSMDDSSRVDDSSGLASKEIAFGAETKSEIVNVVGTSNLVHSWVAEEYINYGYLTQPFGFMRLSQIKVYSREANDVDESLQDQVHKDSYTYTPVAYENNELDIDITSQYFGMLNVTKFNEMLAQAETPSAVDQAKAYKYVLRYDIDGTQITEINSDILDTNFELEAGSHTISGYINTKGLFKSFAGKIENLRMTGVDLKPENTTAGILVDTLKNTATLKSVVVEGQITNSSATVVGGVVGEVEANNGDKKAVLQLIESVVNIDNSKSSITGGVVGKMAGGKLSYASSNGIISNTASSAASNGLISQLKVKVRSRGDDGVVARETVTYSDSDKLASVSGGVVGHQDGGAILNVYNTNSVLGNFIGTANVSAVAGGIVGYHAGGTIDSAYNTGLVGAGNYNVTGKISVAGGIFGYSSVDTNNGNDNKVTNCMNDAAVQSLSKVDKDSQTISIIKNSGNVQENLTADPTNLMFTVQSAYNSTTSFREVYAYGIGYSVDGSAEKDVASSNKTSTDNIKNDGNIGKYQLPSQTLTFNRKNVLGNEVDGNTIVPTGSTQFYATFNFQNGSDNNYTYQASGVDSYGFTNRIYMVDQITRQYGAENAYEGYYNDIQREYNNLPVDNWGWGSLNETAYYKMSSNSISEITKSSLDSGLSFIMKGGDVKYAESVVLGTTYDDILKNENLMIHGATKFDDYSVISQKISNINESYNSLDGAHTTTVNGEGMIVTENGGQFRGALAPNIYEISATVNLPSMVMPKFTLEGNHQFTDPVVIGDALPDGSGGYNRSVTYTAYFASDVTPTNMKIVATYENSFEIAISKSNVEKSGGKTKIYLEDENGTTNVKVAIIKSIVDGGGTYTEGAGTQKSTTYNGYNVYLVNSPEAALTSPLANAELKYSGDSVYVEIPQLISDWTNKNYIKVIATTTQTDTVYGLTISVSKDTSATGTQNISDFSWVKDKMTGRASSVRYRSQVLTTYGSYYQSPTVDMKAIAETISNDIDVFVAGYSAAGTDYFGVKGTRSGNLWSWVNLIENENRHFTISSTGVITYTGSVNTSGNEFFTQWTAYYSVKTPDNIGEFPETASKDFGKFTVEVARDTTAANGGLSTSYELDDDPDDVGETKLTYTFRYKVAKADVAVGTTTIKANESGIGHILKTGSKVVHGVSASAGEAIYQGTYISNQSFFIEYMKTSVNMGEANSLDGKSLKLIISQSDDDKNGENIVVNNERTDSGYGKLGSVDIGGVSSIVTSYNKYSTTSQLQYDYIILSNGAIIVNYTKVGMTGNAKTYEYLYYNGSIYKVTRDINEDDGTWTSSYQSVATGASFDAYFKSNSDTGISVNYIAGMYSTSGISFIRFNSENSFACTNGASVSSSTGSKDLASVRIYSGKPTYQITDSTILIPTVSCSSPLATFNQSTKTFTANGYNSDNVTFKATCKQSVNASYRQISSDDGALSISHIILGGDIYLGVSTAENSQNIVGANKLIKFVSKEDKETELFTTNTNKGKLKNLIVVGVASARGTDKSTTSLLTSTNVGTISNVSLYGNLRNVASYFSLEGDSNAHSVNVKPISASTNLSNIESSVTVNVLDAENEKSVLTEITNNSVYASGTAFATNNILISGDGGNGLNKDCETPVSGGNGGDGGKISGVAAKFSRSGVAGIGGYGTNGKNGKLLQDGDDLKIDNTNVTSNRAHGTNGTDGSNSIIEAGAQRKIYLTNSTKTISEFTQCESVSGVKAFGVIAGNNYIATTGQLGTWKNNAGDLVAFGSVYETCSGLSWDTNQLKVIVNFAMRGIGQASATIVWFPLDYESQYINRLNSQYNNTLKTASTSQDVYHIRRDCIRKHGFIFNGTEGTYKKSVVFANYTYFNNVDSFTVSST